jgi:hypothetical protein
MKKPSEIQGILIKDTKTFYYLECGVHRVANALDRIQSTLLAKDLLSYTGTREDLNEEKIKKMSLQDAQEKGYKIEVFYLNNHVKTAATSTAIPEVKKISWGKK